MPTRGTETISYIGGMTSILSALTLTDIGIIVGILTALMTFALNAVYQYRRDGREAITHEVNMERLLKDRRKSNIPTDPDRRKVNE